MTVFVKSAFIRVCLLLLVTPSLFSCEQNKEGIQFGEISSVRVDPPSATVVTRPGTPVELSFSAYATLYNGEEVPIDLVSWSSSNMSAGDVDEEGAFLTVDTNGGITDVLANTMGIVGGARVTVVFNTEVYDDIEESVSSAFVSASDSASTDQNLTMRYPIDGVIVPRNLEGLGFKWTDDLAGDSTVYRIRFRSEITDVSVYTSHGSWVSSSELWQMIAAANRKGLVQVNIEAGEWDGSSLSDVRAGPTIEINVNRFDARGSVLYWGVFEENQTGAILRIPIGQTEAEDFYTCEGNNCCLGCHAISDDADRMVVTHSGMKYSIVDIDDPYAPEEVVPVNDNKHASFKTLSPDGRFMFGVNNKRASLVDLDTGVELKNWNYGQRISHPDWSPDGRQIVYVRVTGADPSDMEFKGGEIVQVDFDEQNLELTNERVLKPADPMLNFYYPAYSPDGDWIAYNRAKNDQPRADGHIGCYSAPDAEVWLMSRDGSIDIRLDNANGSGNLQNSYPRWGPLPDDEILWLAFSSRRGYPLNPTNLPQIWIVGIDPSKAFNGEDPSSSPIWLPGQSVNNDNHLPVWWSK